MRRLITERQKQLLQVFFGQWSSTVSAIKEKRQEVSERASEAVGSGEVPLLI